MAQLRERTKFEELVKKVCDESYRPGKAQEVMGYRNYWRGFELAQKVFLPQEFQRLFDSEIVMEYVGPWEPKRRALDGARAAVKLGMTILSSEDVRRTEDSYKNILPRIFSHKIYKK